MAHRINGIQQLGIGVEDVHVAWRWYRRYFGMDIGVFDEAAVASLMLPYTGGKPRARHAVLALNMKGGGGFEIWQHTEKKPVSADFEILPGDLGISIGKLKTNDIERSHAHFTKLGLDLVSPIVQDPAGTSHFYIRDVFDNMWEFVAEDEVFRKEKQSVSGGIYGVVIGVKDMDESIKIYRDLLEYDKVVYDVADEFQDMKDLTVKAHRYRRVLLKHSNVRQGAMSPLFGPTVIELVQVLDREPRSIYKDRIWGDLGFIHVCFDINRMEEMREAAKKAGYPFTVDSSANMDTFDMGEANGNFAYIEAPEGTLVEFVEAYKLPIIKKLGINLNFRRRGQKPLPRWVIHLFALKRVK